MSDEGMSGEMLERYARGEASVPIPTFTRDVYRHLLARLDAAERERDEARAIWAEGWLPMDSAPNDAQFLAAIEVSSSIGPTYWQMDVIWLDDETGDIHADCENGWSLSDYDAWMPLPAPPANHSAPVVEE